VSGLVQHGGGLLAACSSLKEKIPVTEAINLAEKLTQFSERWAPRTVAQLNDNDINHGGEGAG